MKAVVSFRQALASLDHQRGTELVVGFPGSLECCVGLPLCRKGEGLEAVRGGVTHQFNSSATKKPRPYLMNTALYGSKTRIALDTKNHRLFGKDPVGWHQGKSEARIYTRCDEDASHGRKSPIKLWPMRLKGPPFPFQWRSEEHTSEL